MLKSWDRKDYTFFDSSDDATSHCMKKHGKDHSKAGDSHLQYCTHILEKQLEIVKQAASLELLAAAFTAFVVSVEDSMS
jgi:hypothetical protein